MTAHDHPDRVGPYRIVQVIGEGGMGVVYDAVQRQPVRRRVALKMLKAGMDSREVMQRFESEQQALAVMDHPGIAKVFDGGTSEAGRPYFAMELVRGVPITQYCDTHRLPTEERILLVIDVCEAVQHAHQKGVIHRDLKPSNVLVTEADGHPAPKVIDFGIAKALGAGGLGDRSAVTRVGQMIGTPHYMSPEQAEMSGLDVDTRADVYSLGMMLYELVVGTLPFPDGRPPVVAPFLARTDDTPTPSRRFDGLGDKRDKISRLRRTDPASLARRLRGDIDWIVMKAIDSDRARRYDTALGLAADLRRLLAHQPVEASPPTAGYRLRKFVRRNRAGVSAAAAAILVALGFAGSMVRQAQRLAAERDLRATEAATASRVTEFLVDLFMVAEPSRARGDSITAREILDRGAERIRAELSDQSAVRGRLMETMGRVYMGLGLYDEAEELLLESLSGRGDILSPSDTAVARSLHGLGSLYFRERRLDEALPVAREAVAASAATFGPRHLSTADAHALLGTVQRDRGVHEEGRSSLLAALDLRRELLPVGDEDIGWTLQHLGWLEVEAGNLGTAQELYREARDVLEAAVDPGDPRMGWLYNDMAVLRSRLGEYQEARDLHLRVLELRESTQGPDHPDVAATLQNLSWTLTQLGAWEEALPLQERANEIRRRAHGAETVPFAAGLMNLALQLQQLGRFAEARDAYEESLRVYEMRLGDSDPGLLLPLSNLGYLYRFVGEEDRALALLRRAVRIGEAAYGPNHPSIGPPVQNLAYLHQSRREFTEAARYSERAYDIRVAELGADHPLVASHAHALGFALILDGREDEAIPLLRSAIDLNARSARQDEALRSAAYWNLGFAHLRLGRTQQADSLFAVADSLGAAGANRSSHAYLQLRSAAIRGDRDQARRWLGVLDRDGYRAPTLLRDPLFDPVRELPEFRSLAEAIRRAIQLDS